MPKQPTPSWKNVKAKLAEFDRPGLLALVQDLYASGKENQAFLHARLGLGLDVLRPYKETLARWLWPDIDQDVSVAKARGAIAAYRKAAGHPAGLAELMVFYCECAAGFCADVGYQDGGYFDALVRMFKSALELAAGLPAPEHRRLMVRLRNVRNLSRGFGYGVGEDIDALLPGG
jgi:hypothetical protein